MNADLSIYLYFVLFFILLVLFVASKIEKRKQTSSGTGKGRISKSESSGAHKDEEAEYP